MAHQETNTMPVRAVLTVSLFLLAIPAAFAQADAWQTVTEFAGLDQSALTTQQKHALMSLLRTNGCNCGCSFKIAECRVKDPKCGRSRSLAATIEREIQEGKSADSIRAELERLMNQAPPVLDEAVRISIEGDPVRGPSNARITLVEFSDFQCPFCAKAVLSLNSLLAKHPADIRLVFKQFPLDIHSQAALAAEAALAANAQGKFWPMHDKLYANYRTLSPGKIFECAKEVDLDLVRFTMDLKSGKYKTVLEKELIEGERAGVLGTPTIFVNGKHYNGSMEIAALEEIVQTELKSLSAKATPSPRSR